MYKAQLNTSKIHAKHKKSNTDPIYYNKNFQLLGMQPEFIFMVRIARLSSRFQRLDQTTRTVKNLLDELGLYITSQALEQKLTTHPKFPSLYAVKDVLIQLGISCDAIKIDPETLSDIKLPCLAHIQKQDSQQSCFQVITAYKAGKVSYIDPEKGSQTASLSTFSENWTGILLVPNQPIEKKYFEQKNTDLAHDLIEQWSTTLTVFALFTTLMISIILQWQSNHAHSWYWLVSTKLTGLAVSILLILKRNMGLDGWIQVAEDEVKIRSNSIISTKQMRRYHF